MSKHSPYRIYRLSRRLHYEGWENLAKLFCFGTAQTHFSYWGNFYDQIDGGAMGSPLATVLANPFMSHHEKFIQFGYRVLLLA